MLHLESLNDFLCGKDIVPVTWEVNLTNICNYKCGWCSETDYRSKFPDSYVDADKLIDFLKRSAELGTKSVTIEGGGEPTMHKDFGKIVNELSNGGLDVGLITNGSMLTNYEKIIVECLKYVRISFDAGTEDIYRKIHGVNFFKRVVDGINRIVEGRKKVDRGSSPVVVGVSYIVSEKNFKDVWDAAGLMKKLGADYIQYKPLIGRDSRFIYVPGAKEVLTEVKNHYEDDKFKIFVVRMDAAMPCGDRDYDFCYAHRFIGAVSANGEVHLCCNLKHLYEDKFSFGNLEKKNFDEIWFGDKRKKILKMVEGQRLFTDLYCGQCRMNSYNVILNNLKKREEVPMWTFF